MKKQILSFMLIFSILATLITTMPAPASATTSSTCGDNLTWTLNDDGTLTISGTGDMTDWSTSSDVPWYSSKGGIKTVVIEDSVTSIGDYAFYWCYALTSITIGNSVTSIGDSAFHYCAALTSITIPNTVTNIGDGAFYMCYGLTNITIPDSVTSISKSAFACCNNLTSIAIPNTVKSIGDAAFWSSSSLTDVYYAGTETAWNSIVIQNNNNALLNATIHYNSIIPRLSVGDSGAVTLRAEGVTEAATVYLAAYDDKGAFVGLQKLVLTEGAAQAKVSFDNAARLKAFVWEADTFSPFCIPGECPVS